MNMAPRNKKSSHFLGLTAMNHISRNCTNVQKSIDFYCNVLDFIEIKRPRSFDFDGAWLFNYGIGIHLLKDEAAVTAEVAERKINHRADHISFQCEDMQKAERGLEAHHVPFIRQVVAEGGILIDQLFFHDPDGHMIEICNCQLLPVEPLPCPRACPVSSASPSPRCTPATSRNCSPKLSPTLACSEAVGAKLAAAGVGLSSSRFSTGRGAGAGPGAGAGSPSILIPWRSSHGSVWNPEPRDSTPPVITGTVWKPEGEAGEYVGGFKGDAISLAAAAAGVGNLSEFRTSQHGLFMEGSVSQDMQDAKRKRDEISACA